MQIRYSDFALSIVVGFIIFGVIFGFSIFAMFQL